MWPETITEDDPGSSISSTYCKQLTKMLASAEVLGQTDATHAGGGAFGRAAGRIFRSAPDAAAVACAAMDYVQRFHDALQLAWVRQPRVCAVPGRLRYCPASVRSSCGSSAAGMPGARLGRGPYVDQPHRRRRPIVPCAA
jgi:hypothetical protein